MKGMVTFVAPTMNMGTMLSLMVPKCFGRIKNTLRIMADKKSRMNTSPTAPNIGVVFFMKTNALLHTAERPMI